MDNKKVPDDTVNYGPPQYSNVPLQYPGSAPPPYSAEAPNTNAGFVMPMPGVVPEVGFSQGFSGGAGQTGFMPPPMGFRIPVEPIVTEDTGHSHKEEATAYLVDDRDGDRLNFSEKSIRMAFIRKVYSILMVQLLLTTVVIALFCFHRGVRYWVQTNTGFMWGSYFVAIVLLIALACCEGVRRKSPSNIILLGLFTITYAIVVGTISSFYRAESVVLAGGITVVVCLGLTIFSFQTKWDFTAFGGILFVALLIIFLFGILTIFLRNTFPVLHIVYAAAGAMLFSCYLVYDTQLMIGGNHKYSISPEEYIFAALNIYTDVIMIFLRILSLVGNRN